MNIKILTRDIAIGLIPALFVLVWVGWIGIDYSRPLKVHDDYVLILFNIKSLLHFGTVYSNAAVAFPETSDYSAFPTPDVIQYTLIRFLGLFSDNPVTVLSLFTVIAFFTTSLSAYLALRNIRISPFLASCGAIVFSASAFMCVRAPLHTYLCFATIIPWLCNFCLLLAYQGPRLSKPALKLKTIPAIILGVIAGSCGLYYAFFGGFFLIVTIMLLLLNRRGLQTIKPALIALGGLLISFFIWLVPSFWSLLESGNKLPKRDYFEQVIYGLRFPDLLIPQLPPFLEAYHTFAARQEVMSSEGNYAALGLWGIIGLIGGLILCLAGLLRHSTHQPALLATMRRRFMAKFSLILMLAGILFAVPYGLGFVFNMLVSATIRAQNRISIFILFFAILITLFLLEKVRRTSRSTSGRLSFIGTTIMLLVATIAPNYQSMAHTQQINAEEWAYKQKSYESVLNAMEQNGLNAIAQYPSYVYPEGPQYQGFGNSDHFWPYLLDTSTDRHWSFGSTAYQPLWQLLAEISQWPTDEFFAALRCLNYDGLLIEKRALPPQLAILFKNHLQAFGSNHILWDDAQRVLVKVEKSPVSFEVCEKTSGARDAIRRTLRQP